MMTHIYYINKWTNVKENIKYKTLRIKCMKFLDFIYLHLSKNILLDISKGNLRDEKN